ncbi:Tctex-1 [Massariosphaeria phaeospora]|uniref:Tctex-1 n=1 Tax=Massariosphaeria phaeospora TaxID=100035 RepID=A0A7C8IAP7_9PLEO|nr:Tctex-1 [Massariosphaeria phaeospora]
MTFPLSTDELRQLIKNAVDSTFSSVEKYEHTQVEDWNRTIISTILRSLIDSTTTGEGESKVPAYKYIANSTIIQHLESPAQAASGGRRGMHSAQAAFWNSEKDGTYSYKWEDGEKIGVDVVISVSWIGL